MAIKKKTFTEQITDIAKLSVICTFIFTIMNALLAIQFEINTAKSDIKALKSEVIVLKIENHEEDIRTTKLETINNIKFEGGH